MSDQGVVAGWWWRALAVCGLVLVGAGCGGDDRDLPLVGEIEAAIAALDAALGGPQDYFEVNATPQLVNLFVVGGDGATATPYVYIDGELEGPAPTQSGTGATFRGDAVDIDPDQVFDTLDDELDDPVITQFVIIGGPDGTVRYEATVLSELGGTLSVVLGPDGEILSVDPL